MPSCSIFDFSDHRLKEKIAVLKGKNCRNSFSFYLTLTFTRDVTNDRLQQTMKILSFSDLYFILK